MTDSSNEIQGFSVRVTAGAVVLVDDTMDTVQPFTPEQARKLANLLEWAAIEADIFMPKVGDKFSLVAHGPVYTCTAVGKHNLLYEDDDLEFMVALWGNKFYPV